MLNLASACKRSRTMTLLANEGLASHCDVRLALCLWENVWPQETASLFGVQLNIDQGHWISNQQTVTFAVFFFCVWCLQAGRNPYNISICRIYDTYMVVTCLVFVHHVVLEIHLHSMKCTSWSMYVQWSSVSMFQSSLSTPFLTTKWLPWLHGFFGIRSYSIKQLERQFPCCFLLFSLSQKEEKRRKQQGNWLSYTISVVPSEPCTQDNLSAVKTTNLF